MPNTPAEALVGQLKAWATEHNLTQAELARLLGVDRRRVFDWYAGKTPSLDHGIKIQELLKTQRRKS